MLFSQGCLYTNINFPTDLDLNKTELGSKVGRASNTSVLWLFTWGNAGVHAAAQNGGLKVINHSDGELFSVFFGIYSKYTTVVYGD